MEKITKKIKKIKNQQVIELKKKRKNQIKKSKMNQDQTVEMIHNNQ